MKDMEKLVNKLNEAAKNYYSESEITKMSDHEYDRLYDELVAMEKETGVVLPDSPTLRVGYAVVSGLKKITHKYPALSLDKTKDPQVLVKWADEKETVLSWKEDGLTLVATYLDGELESAVTRGNGYIGEDVTHNAPYISGLPQKIPFKEELVVRGEVLISYKDFETINESGEYANPRNLAASSLRAYDSYVASKRHLHFKAFSIGSKCEESLYDAQLKWLADMGFGVVNFVVIENPEDIPTEIKYFESLIPDEKDPTDGLVLAYRDREYGISLGTTGKFPKHSIAFKWKDDTKETALKDIEWSASRTGLINPVAVFEPVDLEGTEVKRASIHNLRYLQDLQLGYGDTITVYKANMIIPQIEENTTRNGDLIPIPTHCPVCGSPTERRSGKDTEALYCTNPDCAAKHVGKYVRMVERDALNVVGVSKSAIEKFVERGFLTHLKDLYHLDEYKDEIIEMDGFGQKSYDKMIQAIEVSRDTTFKQFFYALGIPGIGHDVAKILEKYFSKKEGKEKTDLLYTIAVESDAISILTALDGIGWTTVATLSDWIYNHVDEYFDLKKELNIMDDVVASTDSPKQDLAGRTFVITGSLELYANRNELKKEIESRGGKVSGSVSKKTSYLISNEDSGSSKSSKSLKAKELGVLVITETEYKTMFS